MTSTIHQVNVPVPEEYVRDVINVSHNMQELLEQGGTFTGYTIVLMAARTVDGQAQSAGSLSIIGNTASVASLAGNTCGMVRNTAIKLLSGKLGAPRDLVESAVEEIARVRMRHLDPDATFAEPEEVAPPPPPGDKADGDDADGVGPSLFKVALIVCALTGAMTILYVITSTLVRLIGGAE